MYNLEFIPIRKEHYDFLIKRESLNKHGVKIFIENEIYMGKEIEKKTPGFEFILLLIALLLFAFRNR